MIFKNRIGKNLSTLREHYNLTQGELATVIGSTQKSISSYETNRAAPPLELLISLLDHFNIAFKDFIEIDLWAIPDTELKLLLNKNKKGAQILAITVDGDNNENIELIPVKAAAGYAQGHLDPDYLKSLPRFRLPFLPPGTYRAFEIEGFSMMPIEPGSIVVGKYVESVDEMKKGDSYVLIMNDGLVFKRVFNSADQKTNDKLLLVSDNPEYSPFEVNISDVQQIWKADKIITSA